MSSPSKIHVKHQQRPSHKSPPHQGVLCTQQSYRHAAWQKLRSYPYKLACKARLRSHRGIWRTSSSKLALPHLCLERPAGPGTLHRYYSSSLSLYRACSTSHVWMAPDDIFQHCASARDFVITFVIWSQERSSPTQIHENHQTTRPQMIKALRGVLSAK